MSDKTTPQQRRGALAAGVLIALALIVIPNFEVFSRLSYYDAKRLIQIGLYGALTLVLLASLALRERWLQRFSALPAPASWALGLLLAAGVLSALVGDTHDARLAYSLAEVALFAGLLGVAFTTTAVLSVFRKHANTIMLTVITVAIGLYVFRFLSRYSVAISLNEPVYIDALIANFSHLRFFGQWISWTLPLVVITPMLLPARRLRYLPYIIASTWWTLLFLSGTRSTIAAMAGAMILVPLLLGRAGLKWLRLQVVSLVVGLAFYVGGFTLIATTHAKTGIGRLAAKTPFGRDDMWRDAWAMMQDNLLLGAGPQSYAFNLDHLASHPHNAVVQWAAEWGLPSVIVMLALIIFGFVAWVRFARQRYSKRFDTEAVVVAGLTGSVLTAGAHSLLSGIIVMPLSQLYLAVIVGWILCLYSVPEPTADRLPLNRHIALTLSAMLVCLSLLHVALRDVAHLPQLTESYKTEHGKLHPRFWQQGRIPIYRETN